MANTTNINFRVDENVKQRAEQIFSELGFNLSTAMTIFLRQAIRENGIPFNMKLDDDYSLEKAISDTRNRENLYGPYDTAENAFAAMMED